MTSAQKNVQTKIAKGLLNLVVLQFLEAEPQCDYQIVSKIRKTFGLSFESRLIKELLKSLDKKGYVIGQLCVRRAKPNVIYDLTNEGMRILGITKGSVDIECARALLPVAIAELQLGEIHLQ